MGALAVYPGDFGPAEALRRKNADVFPECRGESCVIVTSFVF